MDIETFDKGVSYAKSLPALYILCKTCDHT
jgi:hypothetical protein